MATLADVPVMTKFPRSPRLFKYSTKVLWTTCESKIMLSQYKLIIATSLRFQNKINIFIKRLMILVMIDGSILYINTEIMNQSLSIHSIM